MAKEPAYNKNVCPKCYSTVQLLGRLTHGMYRCTNPLCTNSKAHDGIVAEDKLIDRNRIIIKVKGY